MRTVRCSGRHGGGICPGGCLPDPSPVDRMTDRCKNITLPQDFCIKCNGGQQIGVSFFLIFMQSAAYSGQIICWCPYLYGVAPPRQIMDLPPKPVYASF